MYNVLYLIGHVGRREWVVRASWNLIIIHGISDLYVCLFSPKIGAFPGIGSTRSVPVEGLGGMFLERCCSPSCFAAEERDVLPQFSAGHKPFLT